MLKSIVVLHAGSCQLSAVSFQLSAVSFPFSSRLRVSLDQVLLAIVARVCNKALQTRAITEKADSWRLKLTAT